MACYRRIRKLLKTPENFLNCSSEKSLQQGRKNYLNSLDNNLVKIFYGEKKIAPSFKGLKTPKNFLNCSSEKSLQQGRKNDLNSLDNNLVKIFYGEKKIAPSFKGLVEKSVNILTK